MKKDDFKVFKSDEGRRKVLRHYSSILSSVSFSFSERYVNTTFGKTYVLEAGNPKKQPVVLIHGSCSNSASWFGDIPMLSEHYHVFSLDIVGDAGNSEETRLDQTTDDFSDWLKEALDGLGINKTILIGNSLGGWICLKFAVCFPERVEKLVLIAPSGIVPTKLSFVLKTIIYICTGERGRKAMRKMIFGNDEIPQEVLDTVKLVGDNFNPLTGPLPELSELDLRSLKMPLLYIAGENDATANVEKAVGRLKKLVPGAEIRVIENNGHVVFDTMKWVIPFLKA